jgi:glycosyltransferase involved in cell wall biosynthesis
VFRDARQRLGERLVQLGYVRDRDAYVRWLRRSSVSVSTADQENFGMAAVEAAYAGASPLWPDRLSYPELLGRGDHLYPDMDGLVDRLEHRVRGADDPRAREGIADGLRRFSWDELIGRHDDLLEEAAGA